MDAFGQERGERELDARDAAPDVPDVAALLQLARAGRVVRRDEVHRALPHRAPQSLAFGRRADRWRALERRPDPPEVEGVEGEVMWTLFDVLPRPGRAST